MREALVIYAKGLAMGTADVVPGVSGATIALIVGIYDRLIRAITSIDPRELRTVLGVHRRSGRAEAVDTFERMDGHFLVPLGLGIVSAFVALVAVIDVLLAVYPVPTYAFFFGLIAASAVVLYAEIDVFTPGRILLAVLAIGFALFVTGITARNPSHGPVMVFVSGAIAISAMVLPGVSGSFFLLVLGQYEYMLGVLRRFLDGVVAVGTGGSSEALVESGPIVAIFVGGACLGLLTSAHAVRFALDRYRAATLTVLVSLMVGALRSPATHVAENLDGSTAGSPELAALAALTGAACVLALDHWTDDLTY